MTHDERDIRFAAESIYHNVNMYRQYPPIDFSRSQSHSINFITEDFLAGYMQDGRMSVVRRFFCLFVTFDLFFISLLWLICILINGDNIYNALKIQILHYTIYASLFDIVMAAVCRFVVLILFYAILYINHWIIIALTTTGSCGFLITKVFFFNWIDSPQPVFQVLLIVTSFVLSWGEAWFFDCRVIPQERHARNYISAVTPILQNDRSPLMAPFLNSAAPPESFANFYSPYDSIHNSDDEADQDEEYKSMGKECVRKSIELLESSEWKIEKVTAKGDTIKSTQRDKLGKIYRLTARLQFPAKLLLEHLFYKIEDIPKWNPTILESKVLRKIDSNTDISYQATAGGGGGLVKSRDFINLRCWRLCRNGRIYEPDEQLPLEHSYASSINPEHFHSVDNIITEKIQTNIYKSTSDVDLRENKSKETTAISALSKSLGAHAFYHEDDQSADEEDYLNAECDEPMTTEQEEQSINMYVSSAISIPYLGVKPTQKYIRGENLLSCWAMREIPNKPEVCIFEWLLCLDLKGYFPRYVLDSAYSTLMQDYMVYLRTYCSEVKKTRRKIA